VIERKTHYVLALRRDSATKACAINDVSTKNRRSLRFKSISQCSREPLRVHSPCEPSYMPTWPERGIHPEPFSPMHASRGLQREQCECYLRHTSTHKQGQLRFIFVCNTVDRLSFECSCLIVAFSRNDDRKLAASTAAALRTSTQD
jgi:hypothetical protein